MSKRAAVSIGVDRPGDLPHLSAAASGAKAFTAWAKDQNIDVAEFTDAAGIAVTAADIKKAVREFVEKGSYAQILLYFAGHGMLLGPDDEVWWLSGAPGDAAEAVNLAESTIKARGSGIPHVVWISDACRSLPSSTRFSGVRGVSIFPNPEIANWDADVDFLYASQPGESALEVSANEAGNSYKGLFTTCLLDGLWGRVSEVVEVMAGKSTVPSWALKPYLKKAVPRAAAKVQVTLRQIPDIRAESHPPSYLALLKEPPSQDVVVRGPGPSAHVSSALASLAAAYGLGRFFRTQGAEMVDDRSDSPSPEFQADIERILGAKGRSSFESRTGFSIFGQDVATVLLDHGEFDLFEEDGVHQIRVTTGQRGGSALIQFKGGTGTCLAVIPGYIGTVLVENGRVVNVNYSPSRGTILYADYRDNAEELNKRRAFAAVAARSGYLHLDKRNAGAFAGYVREMKSIDPTLALYASYAYAQAGLFGQVKSVFDFMMNAPDHYVPFDVALLARQLPGANAVPVCPMITQGWSMLGAFLSQTPVALQEAARFLIPSLWSTFDSAGVRILGEAIDGGEFK